MWPITGTPEPMIVPNDVFVAVDAFELDGVSAAPHQCADGVHRRDKPFAVGKERQIGDDELAGRRSRDRSRVRGHHAHGGRQRGRVAVQHHCRRIADENGVDLDRAMTAADQASYAVTMEIRRPAALKRAKSCTLVMRRPACQRAVAEKSGPGRVEVPGREVARPGVDRAVRDGC